MEKISLLPNLQKDPKLEFTKKIAAEILKYKKCVFLPDTLSKTHIADKITYLPEAKLFEDSDLIIALGGDGTILKAAKTAAEYETLVMGINIGHLGFLTQAEQDDPSFFADIFSENYKISKSMLLEIDIVRDEKVISSHLAFNDAVICGTYSKMIGLNISVDDTLMNEFVADGVIFSTAAGSTAYSMSAGGPIIHPKLECTLITPICPHSLNARSVVIPPESVIAAKVIPPYRCDACVTVDGKMVHTLLKNDYVTVKKSDKYTMLLNLPQKNFFNTLRQKLNLR